MIRRVVRTLVTGLLAATAIAGCGDDDDSSRDGGQRDASAESDAGRGRNGSAGRKGSSGAGGRRAGDGGNGGRGGRGGSPAADSGTGGMSATDAGEGGSAGRDAAASGAGGRTAPQDVQPQVDRYGCPSLEFGTIFRLPSCCTSRGMCGVDTTSVAGPGCLDLATAAERARTFGASVVFPAPRTCGVIEEDAGTSDDAGL
jgi:hypothetical protein